MDHCKELKIKITKHKNIEKEYSFLVSEPIRCANRCKKLVEILKYADDNRDKYENKIEHLTGENARLLRKTKTIREDHAVSLHKNQN